MKLPGVDKLRHFARQGIELSISVKIIILLLMLFMVVAASGSLVLHQLKVFNYDAYAINNLGIIRGSIQRVSKRELAGIESIALINSIDQTFDQVHQTYLIDNSNFDYIQLQEIHQRFSVLETCWNKLKVTLGRSTPLSQRELDLITFSEQCWDLANNLTYRVQKLTESKLAQYRKLIITISILVSLFIFIIIFVVYKIVHKSLEVDVISDPMTKLYNRSYFSRVLERQIQLSKRYGYPFSLVFYDIDHFKSINDSFGHQRGDEVLIRFATLLVNNARDVDYVFRLGGEEFATIAPQCNLNQAGNIAEKYRNLVSDYDFNIDRKMTISAGIAEFSHNEASDELVSRADKALYKAKDAGRDAIILADNPE